MSIMESRRTGPPSLNRAGCIQAMAKRSVPDRTALHTATGVTSVEAKIAPSDGPTPPDGASDEPTPTDHELIVLVRTGADASAYGVLYERNLPTAYNLARHLARSRSDADDFVAEAFARVLAQLRAGKGPATEFRGYLLKTLSHVAYNKTRRDRKVELAEDVGEVSGVRAELVSVSDTDSAVARLERRFAARAFCQLPPRWQAVLWHTEVEGHKPAEVAPALGLKPNGVAALAYRARKGLCTAYLQAQVKESDVALPCKTTAARLGSWTRNELCKRDQTRVESHLDRCTVCRGRLRELAANNPGLVLQWDNPPPAPACA